MSHTETIHKRALRYAELFCVFNEDIPRGFVQKFLDLLHFSIISLRKYGIIVM